MKTTLEDSRGSSAGKSPQPKAVHVLIQGDRGPPTARTTFLSLRGAHFRVLEKTRATVISLTSASTLSLSLPPILLTLQPLSVPSQHVPH